MPQVPSSLTDLATRMRGCATGLIAIDGYHGAGKSVLAGQLASALGIRVVHLDDFLVPGQCGFTHSIRYSELHAALVAGPAIVEGVCLLSVTRQLGVEPVVHVYVDDQRPDPSTPRGAGALATEVMAYHEDFRPLESADIVYRTSQFSSGASDVDSSRADVDIAFIQAKTKLALFLAIGGMLTVLVGLAVLLYGVTGADQTFIRIGVLEVSASGLGGVIMITSVVWAFLAYKSRPTYARVRQTSEEYGSDSRLLRRHEHESSTQQVVAPGRVE